MHENSIWLGFAIPEGCAVRTIDIGQSANTILSCYIILHDTNCSIAYPKSSLSLSMIILHWSFSHESRHIVIVCGARILNIEPTQVLIEYRWNRNKLSVVFPSPSSLFCPF